MAQQRNPFDMSEMFRAFDPDQMARMWSPQNFMAMFQQPQAQMMDMEAIIKANQKNFEAMSEANKSAAEAYKDLLDKQMEIFEKMTAAARKQVEWAGDTAGPAQMQARTAAMSGAVEEALKMMRNMAEAARDANTEAYESMQGQMKEAMARVEETAGKAANAPRK